MPIAPSSTRGAGLVGIDIGGTKIAALLVSADGTVLARGSVPAPAALGGGAMADAAADLVRELAAQAEVSLAAAGVGAAGVIDHETGTIRAASATFVGWAGFPLADELEQRLGVPVRVENDVNAFLLGEAAADGRTDRDVLGVMLGTGVGGALIIDGDLHHGPHGAAGEIGHTPGYSELVCTCGQIGHLETLASGTSIALRYQERTSAPVRDAREVADRARGGDAEAIAVFDAAGRALALACASAATILDLPCAIVGGGVTAAWDLLEPSILRTLDTDSPVSGIPLRIIPAVLGSDAVALGAIETARRALVPAGAH
ncbi:MULTISPECIES: ROK family protein [Microbacterium]|uniref:ROK family protein n=1 Tax=Microbacterium maritypicum TaxID=33918 RepID=A0ACD4B1R9_MICMQ|nr:MULTISPECIES: ROK family protein [Microbacterium]UTT51445.1 ROK family protein [Microbacterium liquefaciens]